MEVFRPAASTTAVSPKVSVARVTAERDGRVNGAASPIVTGRGSRSLAASRWAAYPCPARGAWPAAIAATADNRPARSAGTSAPIPVSASMPSGTAMLIHSGTETVNAPPFSSGNTHQLPTSVPMTTPAMAGMPSWATYVVAT
jgi:hypothetical protein